MTFSLLFAACSETSKPTRRVPRQQTGILVLREHADPTGLAPIAASPAASPAARLGEQLFFDKRLSRDLSIACSSCHAFDKGGADARRTSLGVDGTLGIINAPTVLNASLNFVQFWDGRAASLEEQVQEPIENSREMATTLPAVVERLRADKATTATFVEVFGSGPNPENIKSAIAAYERTLLTPDSRFDRYLRGERAALNAEEQRGFELFKNYGCSSCHQGTGIGGNMFQRFGVMGNYFADRGGLTEADLGRFNVTKRDVDRHVFKVPSLRNVALTAPYFHDGSATTLEDAVRVMAQYQLGRELRAADTAALAAFLRTLTGTLPTKPGP